MLTYNCFSSIDLLIWTKTIMHHSRRCMKKVGLCVKSKEKLEQDLRRGGMKICRKKTEYSQFGARLDDREGMVLDGENIA